jgi:hypothetical protein
MKFNPIKRILYTDNGEVIKKLNCPYKVSFSAPVPHTSLSGQTCDICNGTIVDTSTYADDDLLSIIRSNINVCFKIDPYQPNVKIVYVR